MLEILTSSHPILQKTKMATQSVAIFVALSKSFPRRNREEILFDEVFIRSF